MTMFLLGDIHSTNYDYYISHLRTKIDTNGDWQVVKMDIQQHIKELMAKEQRTLFAAWSTLNDDQKEALLLLIKRI